MKKKALLWILAIVAMFLIVGCGNSTGEKNVEEKDNTTVEHNDPIIEETTDPNKKIANLWMKLPENVDLVWETDEKNTNDGELRKEYKRGNNILVYPFSIEDGVIKDGTNNAITNQYYYYHYQGEYNWTSYVYYYGQGWDNWYFDGNYPSSPQNYSFGRPWTVLDEYSDNHESIEIEGLGTVDTVTGTDEKGYTYYYSKELGLNVKIENIAQSWTLVKYDTNVTSVFPYELPDMETLDKSRD